MALEKVLALDSSGVIEKEIDTGGSGGGDYGFPTTISVTDANSITSGGCYNLTSPYTNGPTATFYHIWHSQASLTATQLAVESNSYPATARRYSRSKGSGGVWTAWTELIAGPIVTVDNICDLVMDGTSLINVYAPIYYKAGVGAAQLLTAILPPSGSGYPQIGVTGSINAVVGTGASNGFTLGSLVQNAGTTTTGYASAAGSIAGPAFSTAYYPYEIVCPKGNVGSKIAASVGHYVSALSDATNSYTSLIALIGSGPNANNAIAAADTGIMISYTHSVNSGNYVINYRGEDGTLKTVNTTVAPGVTLSNSKRIIVKAHRSAAGVATITVSIAGTVYTITDSAFNITGAYHSAALRTRIVKSAGTAAVTQVLLQPVLVTNFT